MATPVTMPMLGLTMEEGTVAEWLKREGESVAKDEALLTVEMDKGTLEVPSPAAGVLRRIVVQAGTTVPVKTLIAEIGDAGEVLSSPQSAAAGAQATATSPQAAASSGEARSSGGEARSSGAEAAASSGEARASGGEAAPTNGQRLFVTPRARLRARDLNVDLSTVHGSGPYGRIVEADVLASAATEPQQPRAQASAVEPVQASAVEPVQASALQPVQALSRVRRITAERMAASTQATARVTLFLEADFSEANRLRDQLQPEFARLGVPKLPWDALLARAAALALLEHPAVVAQWVDGQGLRTPDAVHVGVGVALEPEGLVVPVLRDAATRSLRELAADLLTLVDKARGGRLSPSEMQGGTFTITNLGAYRVDGFTPILNPPETAILGVGRIADKAVVIDGLVQARRMCTLSLSFDHRVVDGVPAAAFLARLAELLERPYALLGI